MLDVGGGVAFQSTGFSAAPSNPDEEELPNIDVKPPPLPGAGAGFEGAPSAFGYDGPPKSEPFVGVAPASPPICFAPKNPPGAGGLLLAVVLGGAAMAQKSPLAAGAR